jgi:hypothetical protein
LVSWLPTLTLFTLKWSGVWSMPRGRPTTPCFSAISMNIPPAKTATSEDFLSRPVDGVLVTCWADSTAYATLVRHSFPAVFFNRLSPTLCLTRTISSEGTVSTDNVQAGYAATRHLIELGHERIAMPVGHTALSPYHDRLEGFRKAMQESNLPNRDEYLICGMCKLKMYSTPAPILAPSSDRPWVSRRALARLFAPARCGRSPDFAQTGREHSGTFEAQESLRPASRSCQSEQSSRTPYEEGFEHYRRLDFALGDKLSEPTDSAGVLPPFRRIAVTARGCREDRETGSA